MLIVQFIQQKNDQEGNQKHIINFSWPCCLQYVMNLCYSTILYVGLGFAVQKYPTLPFLMTAQLAVLVKPPEQPWPNLFL